MLKIKKIRNSVFKLLHKGDNYYCLLCDNSYNKFIHSGVKASVFKKYQIAGAGYKKNIRCPNCGSVPRVRLLALFFQLRTNVFNQKTEILHISPNKLLTKYLKQKSTVNLTVGAFEPDEFKEFNAKKIDVQKIDFEDNLFDIIICNHVLEHVENDFLAMKEIYRVLKPGGFAILQVPLALDLEQTIEDKSVKTDKERKIKYGQTDHIRLYGLDYFDRLKNAGFRVVRDNPYINKWLPENELSKHLLDKIEDVIISYKD